MNDAGGGWPRRLAAIWSPKEVIMGSYKGKFLVRVETIEHEPSEATVSAEFWHTVLYHALEMDPEVIHYEVYSLLEESK